VRETLAQGRYCGLRLWLIISFSEVRNALKGIDMKDTTRIIMGSVLLALAALSTGCVVAGGPREGYYDRDHHRYYHERNWVDCREHDDHCH
jgi:hypothetical protein